MANAVDADGVELAQVRMGTEYANPPKDLVF